MRFPFIRPESLPTAACLAACLATFCGAAPADAAMSIYMTPEQLAERSSHIVEATVRDVATGEDPATGAIATYITLDVLRVLHGRFSPDGETVVLREPGGAIDGRVHEVDAVPVYRPGERVIAFLEPAADGALRTTGMFFGKYVVDATTGKTLGSPAAWRDLDGRGTIVGRAVGRRESATVADLTTLARGVTPRARSLAALERPPELGRVRWAATAKFGPLSEEDPTRWQEGADGLPIAFDVERARNPLGDGALAALQIERAAAAWTAVPESRVVVVVTDTDAAYTAQQPASPARAYPPRNVVLFGDPYDDIADPGADCSGVLAIGGHWRTTEPAGTANGVAFHRARRGYVIFNDGFECFLGHVESLAEVATHELGHVLGFGHSNRFDAIMRSVAYGGRGPRLGDDDRDAAHCHYPHSLTLTAPSGGAVAEAAETFAITWIATDEAGSDPGVVTVEASFDGGAWESLATDVANTGYHGWLVPLRASTDVRVRVVRPNRVSGSWAPYPAACSASVPSAPFTIVVPAPAAGSVPPTLRVGRAPGGGLQLDWSPSCSDDVDNHAVYSGSLQQLRAGNWDLMPRTCSAGADLAQYVQPWAGGRFYLVTPLASGVEGGLGTGSGRTPRPRSAAACGVAETAHGCRW